MIDTLEFRYPAFFFICVFWFHFLKIYWKKYERFDKLPEIIQAALVQRMISGIHGLMTTILPIYILLTDDGIYENKVQYQSPLVSFTLTLTIAYLTFDAYYMYLYQNDYELGYLIHHIGSVTAFIACVKTGCFAFVAIHRLTSELSTTFVNIKYILSKGFNMKNSNLYYITTWTVTITFFLCRVAPIIPNWIIFYSIIQTPEWPEMGLIYKIIAVGACIPLDILNILWFNAVVKSLKRYLKERNEFLKNSPKKAKVEDSLSIWKQNKIWMSEKFSKFKSSHEKNI